MLRLLAPLSRSKIDFFITRYCVWDQPLGVALFGTNSIEPVCHHSHCNHNHIAANYLENAIFVLAKRKATHRPQNYTYKKPSFFVLLAAPYRGPVEFLRKTLQKIIIQQHTYHSRRLKRCNRKQLNGMITQACIWTNSNGILQTEQKGSGPRTVHSVP